MLYKENLSFPGTNPQQSSKFLRTECRQSSCETSPVTASDAMQLYLQVSESLSKQVTILLDTVFCPHINTKTEETDPTSSKRTELLHCTGLQEFVQIASKLWH